MNTLRAILHSRERGGLTSNVSLSKFSSCSGAESTLSQGLVYRYDFDKADDGVGGEEGTFCLCTLWCVEALARAGEYDKALLTRAVSMFEVSVRLRGGSSRGG